ncbi:class I SAM-dependent methyltransferase [Solicola gregarius]|uniref:Class I SAM-dependent methyltransferase n=1 Tax=Solicola gregarius TaxID=2908642 RepID=A0AA46TM62_9ACTN|nr:class I SAM-dependent methyltransferase [Solicola gregarius]UYM06968.1 class I SAM-dependent methyltransferase [Solicola gregarius]
MVGTTLTKTIQDIDGWFGPVDQILFEYFLRDDAPEAPGDLVELGAYKGKSAAWMGGFLRDGETFTVCDLFGAEAEASANAVENQKSYATLDRVAFEENYRAVRGDLPVVIQGLSSSILEHVSADSARFVHVDASHLYPHVLVDLESAETMLKPGGVVAFDDYRSAHTPGVAAVVWGAIATGRLHPICMTRAKMYGVFGDPTEHASRLRDWLATHDDAPAWVENEIDGRDIVRFKPLRRTKK